MFKKTLFLFFAFSNVCNLFAAEKIIEVSPVDGSDNQVLVQAIKEAAGCQGKPVTIKLKPGVYDFSRSEASKSLYYVSNTTSEAENADPVKHIAVLLKDLKNVTLDGCGSTLLMTGEMTSLVVDHCRNMVLKNFNIDHENPTQPECTVKEVGEDYLVVEVHPSSRYQIVDGKLAWFGDGWSFQRGIAQSYDPVKDITWRSWSPMDGLKKAVEIKPHLLYLQYDRKPEAQPGYVFQMRDGIRDEVCGFINRSENVRLENVNFHYLGNFSVVCQYSEDLTFHHNTFMPKPGSGRTNAGFADFLHVSGCKGKVSVTDCIFAGAHDDPINVHGTHLKVMEYVDGKTLKIRFMHPQTYGFEAFFKGDEVELVHAETLRAVWSGKITSARMANPREMIVTLNKSVPESVRSLSNVVMENITWTPEVLISGNRFSRVPTRGILLSTRRKSVIENNVFYGMQMSAILVADDAMSWYESGPVHDLVIRRNTFLQCGGPVICIAPEYQKYDGPVHRNIRIEDNVFESDNPNVPAIYARGVDGLTVRNNSFEKMQGQGNKVQISDSQNVDCDYH